MIPCGRASDKIEIFSGYKYLHFLFSSFPLYYAGSPKVPPLGPKTLRGQLLLLLINVTYFLRNERFVYIFDSEKTMPIFGKIKFVSK